VKKALRAVPADGRAEGYMEEGGEKKKMGAAGGCVGRRDHSRTYSRRCRSCSGSQHGRGGTCGEKRVFFFWRVGIRGYHRGGGGSGDEKR